MTAAAEATSSSISILWISFTRLGFDLHSNSLLDILRQLTERGHKVSLIALKSKDVSRTKNQDYHVIAVPLKGFEPILPVIFTIALFFYLPFYLIFSKVDVIVIDPYIDVLSIIPEVFLLKLKKIRYILDIRSTPVEINGFRGFLRKFWYTASVNIAKSQFNGMTIITPLMRSEVCRTFSIHPDSVGTWSSGVDIGLFNPTKNVAEGKILKEKLGLSEKFVVFYHGVLTPTRGLEKTVEGIDLLRNKYPDIVIFFLGSGLLISRLKCLVKEKGLEGNVVIHDPVDQSEVPKFISMSDVCIVPLPNHPYWRSQSPLKLLEYLSMAKVVILSDIPAHRSVLGEEKCGVYLSSVEPTKIADAIEYSYLNRASLEELGKVGRNIVEKNYIWEKVALDLEKYLLSVKKETKIVKKKSR